LIARFDDVGLTRRLRVPQGARQRTREWLAAIFGSSDGLHGELVLGQRHAVSRAR